MIPILYKTITEGTVPSHYGIGPLTDALSAQVTEERNGAYELALTYPASGIHAEDIEPNAFIMAKPNFMDDPQLFRISKVSATIAGKFTVQAYHISYDLSGKVIDAGTAGSCAAACALLTTKAGNFAITTDKTSAGDFTITEPSSVRSWFGGRAGSLLDIYGGEWAYDNYGASLKTSRGADRGVTIRYGVNLTQLSQVLDMSNLCTGIIPYYKDQNGNQTVGTRVPTGLSLDAPRDKAVDFSTEVKPESSVPIATQLANLAAAYISNNELTNITKSITLDFVQSGAIQERVDLCDTVSLYFEALGISAKAKCVKTVWDVLEGRYTKTTFGSIRPNIADTIAENKKELTTAASREDVSRATELITGNRGGYVILHDSDGDGLPDELLIMNTDDINTATKCWRFNKAGLGYSDTGYAGPYGLAMTSDGEIDADFLKVGVISDIQGNSTIDMTDGEAILNNLKAKRALILVDANGVERGQMKYTIQTGAAIFLREPNNQATVSLVAGTQNDAALSLIRSNGTSGAVLEVDEDNGSIGLYYDATNKERIRLQANWGFVFKNASNKMVAAIYNSSANGGDFSVYNSSGALTATMYSNASSGAVVIYNNNSSIIDLDGNNGRVTCVSLVQTSSRKVKKNIKELTPEEAGAILQLQAVSFDYKNEGQGKDKRGFIAEDVAEIIPGLVTPETETTPAALDYIGMLPYIQTVLKEQDRRIKELEKKIKDITGG